MGDAPFGFRLRFVGRCYDGTRRGKGDRWTNRTGWRSSSRATASRARERPPYPPPLSPETGTSSTPFAPRGRLLLALSLTIKDDKVAEIDVIADPARLHQLDLAVLDH